LVLLHTRCRIAGTRYPVGTRLMIPELRVAAHLTRCGAARPADERTRLDVALFAALDAALPKS